MNYCSHCGKKTIVWRIPAGDDHPRHQCESCNTIYYDNPRIVAGCIPAWEDAVLLCKRAIEPRRGFWTLPAGFMENDETTVEAAARETLEEANARVDITSLYTVLNIPHANQVYMMFRSTLLDLDYSDTTESSECTLVREHEVPWNALAFPTIVYTLRRYFADLRTNSFGFYTGDIVRDGNKAVFWARRGNPASDRFDF